MLASILVVDPDRAFSRKQLLVHVWDRDAAIGPRTDESLGRTVTVFEEKPGRLISASLAWGF